MVLHVMSVVTSRAYEILQDTYRTLQNWTWTAAPSNAESDV